MLIDMMTGRAILEVPFKADYKRFMSLMTQEDIDRIEAKLNEMIDGTEIQTAGWMPGHDWTDTPYEAIYVKAARYNYDLAAKCFGLMVWKVFMDRPETWTSGRFEKDGEPIGSRTYFQPKPMIAT